MRWYRRVKSTLKFEDYLQDEWIQGRRILCQLRGGTLSLRVETGRREGLEREERRCKLCESKEVEDVQHFIEDCIFYGRGKKYTRREIMRGGGNRESRREIMRQLVRKWAVRRETLGKIKRN